MIGNVSYYGPPDGQAIDNHCRTIGANNASCWVFNLNNLLAAKGSVVAFDTLVELMEVNADADRLSHELAHQLGHHAYYSYGYDITLTLAECSYKVFQGCLHGALQAYFMDLTHLGETLDRDNLAKLCSGATNRFESYTCLHGVGHGIVMYTNYKLDKSLDLCALLETSFAQRSCYGGAFMENVVAFLHSLDPDYEAHGHGDEEPTFWVDPNVPAYPCDVMKKAYKQDCWEMQTSLILHFNNGNFREAGRVCDAAKPYHLDCWASLGRDAPSYGRRDPNTMTRYCAYGGAEEEQVCVRAFTAGLILQDNNPETGLQLCPKLPADNRPTCYRETGRQARNMLTDEEGRAICDQVPALYTQNCLDGLG